MPESEAAKRVPHSLEAERAVLGACLFDRSKLDNVREKLAADDFYAPAHRLIYECICRLADADSPCDLVTLGEELRSAGELERVGGLAYLSGLVDAVPAPSAAGAYADIVADNARMRALSDAMAAVMAGIQEGGLSVQELLDMAEKSVFGISQEKHKGELLPLSDLLRDVYQMMSNIKAAGGVTGIPTFGDLDQHYLSGLQKGDLVLLAARPGCGKTSMALNIAQNAAVRHGKTVAIFSLEMPKEQLVQRMLCTQAKVDHSRVRKGMASAGDFSRLAQAVSEMGAAKIYIDDSMNINATSMRSKCRKLKMDAGLDLVVVDYIQLMQSTSNRRIENRQLEVAEISRSLKELAKELDVPVLALSQLSRQAESSKEPPGLAHLRESGALEQDADVVIMLHRPKAAGEDEEEGEESWKNSSQGEQVQVIVAKHRNGPTGTVEMLFVKQYTSFHDLTQNWAGGEAPPVPEEAPPEAEGLPPMDSDIF